MSRRFRPSSPFPSCFRPSTDPEVAPPRLPTHPNLTTSLYRTESGLFGLTWSRDRFGRSLHLHIHLDNNHRNDIESTEPQEGYNDHDHHEVNTVSSFPSQLFSSKPSFHLQVRPWKKRGSQRLLLPPPGPGCSKNNTMEAIAADVYWDLSRAKFGSGPAPSSGFYVAIMIDGEMKLLVGDANAARATSAAATTRSDKKLIRPPQSQQQLAEEQVMVLRREHVYGDKAMLYTTKAEFGGREREISIDCRVGGGVDEPRLYFSVDGKRVLQIKHLKWKFRGNERIQVEGTPIQVSWDVHSWLFQQQQKYDHEVDRLGGDHHGSSSYALFMFKIENPSPGYSRLGFQEGEQQRIIRACGFGFESHMMKKGGLTKMMLRSGRLGSHHPSSSSSSSCLSSASSGCSSVMEWESVEENELKDPSGLSLLVYAWKS